MEIRDPVHGSIAISKNIEPIIQSPFFQRLRNIKQLGFSEYVFPGATHTRYIHSIGVMSITDKIFNHLFPEKNNDFNRLRETVKIAALLHDIGHAPLSHSTESVMPNVSALKLPRIFHESVDRQASHEDYTIKIITDSSLTESLALSQKQFQVCPNAASDLVRGISHDPSYFIIDNVNYFPLLSQIVSSELDADRMDYLLRDSYFSGVSYGNFDLDWLIDNLACAVHEGVAYLGISERAISTFDDFLLCRLHMFLMVYFHYRPVCLEQMLMKYFKESTSEYAIPAEIEAYREHDDYYLMKVLKSSSSKWAQDIVANNIVPKIYESHRPYQHEIYNKLIDYLNAEKIDFIKCSSVGRLSKYYNEKNSPMKGFPIKVIHQYPTKTKISNIDDVTDLYEKYSKSHLVQRIYCHLQNLSVSQNKEIEKIILSDG
jgi:HD superfamily phosphohydrolase